MATRPKGRQTTGYFTIRALPELREMVAASASAAGRSISEEIATRLTASYQAGDLVGSLRAVVRDELKKQKRSELQAARRLKKKNEAASAARTAKYRADMLKRTLHDENKYFGPNANLVEGVDWEAQWRKQGLIS